MGRFKGLTNVMAPEIENTEEALQKGLANLTWANSRRRYRVPPHLRSASLPPSRSPQRADTPLPPVPERNPARPGYTLRIQQIQQEHQLEVERQLQENPLVRRQETSESAQSHPEHPRRVTSLSDAELSKYLRKTRPGLQKRETLPDSRRGNPTIQEVRGRRTRPAIHQGLHHPQSERAIFDMAGIRRTGYLDVAAANTQRITPHQAFLKGQVKRQQDATNEWARRTGKSAPPYQFEDFIGKGAYGRVFRA